MKRFGVVLSVWAMGLAWVLGGVVPVSASALVPAAASAVAVAIPGGFTSLSPSRLLDTRVHVGVLTTTPVAAHGTVHLQVTGRGGVPATGVSAVVLNVTVTAPTTSGFVTVYADGTALPGVSNLNFVAAQTVPNLVIAPVGANGKVALYNGSAGTVHLIADVSGYYRAGAPTVAGAFGSLAPSRLLDTRTGVGAPKAVVAAAGTVHLQVTGRGGVPATGVSAVVLNVTVTAPTGSGYVTVYADGEARPTASNLNFVKAQTVPDLVIAPVGANGKVAVYNGSSGTTQLVADVAGWFSDTNLTPGPVTNVTAIPAAVSIALSWTNPSTASLTGVMIRRAYGATPPQSAAEGMLLTDVPKPATSFTDTYAESGTQYSYALFAHNGTPLYATAGTVTATTVVPGPVTNVTAIPASTSIALSWTNPTSASFTGVLIYRVPGSVPPAGPGGGTRVTDAASPANSFTDTGLASGTQYSYGLFAHDGTPVYATVETATSTTVAVPPPLVIGTTSLAAGTAGLSYLQPLTATGGQAPYAWAATGLPTGLTVAPDGVLAGTPASTGATAIILQVTDSAGATATATVFIDVVGSGTIKAGTISAGSEHTCAVTTGGAVKCWGDNLDGELGNGSSHTLGGSTIPVDVVGLGSGVAAVSAGTSSTCAVTTGRAVKCWGYNNAGELGDGTTTESSTPVDVVGLGSGVATVSTSDHSCAVTTGGAVKCWGYNAFGQLGDGTTTSSSTPVDVVGLSSGVAAVSAGTYYTCAVTTGGAVKCWGYNAHGQVGDGTTIGSTTPVDVIGLGSGVAAVSAGQDHSCAVATGGAVKCWGYNAFGQLGDGTTTSSSTPVDVIGLGSGVAAVSNGLRYSCALTTGGAVKCWGFPLVELGDGTRTDSATPIGVVGLGSGVAAVSAGRGHTCVVTTGGAAKCWGYNDAGQRGDGTRFYLISPLGVIGFS